MKKNNLIKLAQGRASIAFAPFAYPKFMKNFTTLSKNAA
jgi:hypothetical protein